MEMKKYKLGEIAKNITDGEHGTVIDDITGTYYLLSNKNIINGQILINPKTDRRINKETFDKINKRTKLEKGDVLISTVGTLGKTCIVEEKINYTLQRSVGIIKPNLDVLKSKYLMYLLMTDFYQNLLINNSKGAVQKCIFIDDLKQLPIQIPPLPTQQKIAAILSSLDDKIALNKKINAKLEAMVKRLYDYWFVQFDFPNGDGKPYKTSGGKMVWNEVLKREIPEGWEVGALSDIANITMGQSPEGSSYNENGRGTIFYQGSTDFGIRFPTVRMFTTEPARFAQKGDILMSVRAPVGAMNIANTDCCIGRGLSAMNSKIGSITYLYCIMDYFRHTFENKNGAGTTFGSITKDELFELPVVIPDSNILKQFEFVVKPIFDKQMNIGFEIQKLTDLRDRLLPLLMNGQVEVEG